MGLRAFNHSVNVLAFTENNQIFAATYAWFTQVGYEEVMGLLGSQSITANHIKKGQIVGISACSKQLKELAIKIGETHSNEVKKLDESEYSKEGTAILLNDAKVQMVCEVKDILHLESIEDDYLVYFKVKSFKTDSTKEFLNVCDID